ncbi:Sec-independent protein translocase subunit TatA [Nocardioides sp. CBS4Y-1]|uniref:Sec-independent protein translocase protein TatA n=2 Tax=Nocardioides acrostichi TaxID=2784339 RepID=A0A930V4J4_9ACTN|nr:Sec-independent protein translocase subunit TatA [Nocardioides acrostichi]
MPGAPELILILVVVVFLFGAAKLPDLARGTGQALRIFKAETKGLMDDESEKEKGSKKSSTAPAAELPAQRTEETTQAERDTDQQHG